VIGDELRGPLEQREALFAECALPRLVAVSVEVPTLLLDDPREIDPGLVGADPEPF
jgi:hypothetical protein